MKIRKATKKDFKEIAVLMLKEFSKPPFNEKVSLKNVLRSLIFYNKIGKIHIAIENKEIIGVVVFKIEQYWEGPVILIEDLAIKEDFKKQEMEKKLMNYVENYSKNKKIKRILFTTNKKSSSVKFYQKHGYKLARDTVSMMKVLG